MTDEESERYVPTSRVRENTKQHKTDAEVRDSIHSGWQLVIVFVTFFALLAWVAYLWLGG